MSMQGCMQTYHYCLQTRCMCKYEPCQGRISNERDLEASGNPGSTYEPGRSDTRWSLIIAQMQGVLINMVMPVVTTGAVWEGICVTCGG